MRTPIYCEYVEDDIDVEEDDDGKLIGMPRQQMCDNPPDHYDRNADLYVCNYHQDVLDALP